MKLLLSLLLVVLVSCSTPRGEIVPLEPHRIEVSGNRSVIELSAFVTGCWSEGVLVFERETMGATLIVSEAEVRGTWSEGPCDMVFTSEAEQAGIWRVLLVGEESQAWVYNERTSAWERSPYPVVWIGEYRPREVHVRGSLEEPVVEVFIGSGCNGGGSISMEAEFGEELVVSDLIVRNAWGDHSVCMAMVSVSEKLDTRGHTSIRFELENRTTRYVWNGHMWLEG